MALIVERLWLYLAARHSRTPDSHAMQSRTSDRHAIENSRKPYSRELQTVMQPRTPDNHADEKSRKPCSRELQAAMQSRTPDSHAVENSRQSCIFAAMPSTVWALFAAMLLEKRHQAGRTISRRLCPTKGGE